MGSLGCADDIDPSLLILIIDTNKSSWKDHHSRIKNDLKLNFETCVKSLALFCQAYFLFHRGNRVVVISAGENDCETVYPSSLSDVPIPYNFQQCLIDNLLAKHERSDDINKEISHGTLSKAFSKSLCIINKQIHHNPQLQAQIVVLQMTHDDAVMYNQIMNSIFSAQKLNVCVDSLVLFSQDSTFLQQASLITNGVYLHPHDQRGILQLMLTHFLPSPRMRSILVSPVQKTVDFRASCFCHQKPIDFAYMCSVCLSITCEIIDDTCATCGSRQSQASGSSSTK